jgi:hypothetical protein
VVEFSLGLSARHAIWKDATQPSKTMALEIVDFIPELMVIL